MIAALQGSVSLGLSIVDQTKNLCLVQAAHQPSLFTESLAQVEAGVAKDGDDL